MGDKFGLEETIASQERRLLLLRRQAVRGGRHVVGRLKQVEQEYFLCKRELKRLRRRTHGHEWKTAGQYDIESVIRD
jgi:hypothetical protein